MVTLKLRVPAPSGMLFINLLGLLGLIGVAIAVGGLAHNAWWSLAVASVEAILLSVIGAMNAEPREQAKDDSAEDTVVRVPRAV